MAVTTRKFIAAGATQIRYGVLDSDGFLLGTTTNLIAGAQAGSNMLRFSGIKEVPISTPESEVVTVTGDDTALGQFIFDATDLPQGTLLSAVRDFDLEALATGLIVETIAGGQWMAGGFAKNLDLRDMTLIVQRRARSQSASEVGSARWEGFIIPVCSIKPLDSDAFSERTPAGYRYQVITQMSDAHPWGQTLSVSLSGTCQRAYHSFVSEYPYNIQAWRGNGAQTVFNFALEPVTSADTRVAVEGVIMPAGYVIDPTAKTLTFTAAPVNNARIHVLHQYNETC